MTTTTATPALPTTALLTALVGLLRLAGVTVDDTRGDVFRGARTVWATTDADLRTWFAEIRVGAKSGKVTGARVFPHGDGDPIVCTGAAEVVETIGMWIADQLPRRHEQDQPVPAADTLVIYHGGLGAVRGVYRVLGYTDRQGRHALQPVWSIDYTSRIFVSAGCRSITPLPRP
jgi:hypothetical protein